MADSTHPDFILSIRSGSAFDLRGGSYKPSEVMYRMDAWSIEHAESTEWDKAVEELKTEMRSVSNSKREEAVRSKISRLKNLMDSKVRDYREGINVFRPEATATWVDGTVNMLNESVGKFDRTIGTFNTNPRLAIPALEIMGESYKSVNDMVEVHKFNIYELADSQKSYTGEPMDGLAEGPP